MVIIIKYLLVFCILGTHLARGSEIELMFKQKKFQRIVSKYYNQDVYRDLPTRDLIMLSHSLRALKRYRDDAKVVARLIRKDHEKNHQKIRTHIREKETLDAEDYPKSLPILYWYLYNDYAQILLSYKSLSPKIEKDQNTYNTFRHILGELEFREGKVEKLNDKVTSHIQYLHDKVYHFTASWNLQYVSWQHDATITRASTQSKTGLILTNQGYCLGGDIGIANGFYHFMMDGCYLVGSGGVSAYGDPNVTYEQNTPAMGVKIGPVASMIVSSTGSRIGIGLPVIYTSQKLTQPADPDYTVEEESPLSYMATLNSRWQFDKWYLRAEFGQYFQKQESFWGLGFGRQF